MKESLKYMAYIIVAIFVFLTVRTIAIRPDKPAENAVVHDTIWIEPDTITLPPIVKDSLVTHTVPYPVYVPGEDNTVVDTFYADIPIMQYHFNYPDKADIWASGFNVTIDNAVFYTQHEAHYSETTTDKSGWFFCYVGTDIDYLFNSWNYNLYFEADAVIRKRASLGAKAGFMVYSNNVSPFVGVTLKYKLN